ncbi:hypothetical protein [Streptomyces sp. NBC_01264]|uniref:hypothetical protein n=1 Tax=Streptomyces sp. NBC_01264 TaxID=2903804 RepID=UPI0022542101|nr:hypothetical protein [Streptomyces sp. NBC_01264]MCX4781389.1 hypothetical protein [Streptomyces sp. NBC_01264]
MPSTLPSRRGLLAGAAGIAGAVLLSGCSDDGPPAADPEVPLERRMRETAVRESERLLERYDATAAAHPDLAQRLAPLRASVAAHTAALADEGAPSASRSPSPVPSGAEAAAPPAPGAAPVPAAPADALTALADAERSLAEARTLTLAGAPGELARMLASVAACGHVHSYLLTSNPGASS